MKLNRLLIATHNQGKVDEFRAILGPLGIEVTSAKDFHLIEPAETGKTFYENADIKSLAAARATGLAALADDSGICVEALNGEPGVYSADWAVTPVGRDFDMAMKKVNDRLGANPNRRAYFISVLSLASPDGAVQHFEGRVEGTLIWPPRGEKGFGFDPMFVPDGYKETFAEMPKDQKNKISHRARSLEKFLQHLKLSS
jgi:XTP/dITP diphosphohydrolase